MDKESISEEQQEQLQQQGLLLMKEMLLIQMKCCYLAERLAERDKVMDETQVVEFDDENLNRGSI